MTKTYHEELRQLLDEYAQKVYFVTKKFPREEIFGITSQLRRSALSVVLNYIEGYARQERGILKNFIEISYGSLKESQYLIYFSFGQQMIDKENYEQLSSIADKIGKMLWGILSKLKKK